MSAAVRDFGYHTEQIDGVEVEKPLPKKLHAIIENYSLILLAHSAKPYRSAPGTERALRPRPASAGQLRSESIRAIHWRRLGRSPGVWAALDKE